VRTLSSTCAASSRVGVRIKARMATRGPRRGVAHRLRRPSDQALQHGQREAGGLAGAGLGAGQQVAALEHCGMACAWMGVGVS
jgi:hypothetical protein